MSFIIKPIKKFVSWFYKITNISIVASADLQRFYYTLDEKSLLSLL